MYMITGGCHCGNNSYLAEFTIDPAEYIARLCDCNFCSSHGAAYASDSKGKLVINIKKQSEISKYRQGSRLVDFIICKTCGVLTNVVYKGNNNIYASINIRTADEYSAFGKGKVAHLAQLTDEERIKRWESAWFHNVELKCERS